MGLSVSRLKLRKHLTVSTALFIGYLSSLGQVALVAHQKLEHFLITILVDLSKPIFDPLKRVLISNVVDDDDAVGTSIVAAGYRFKSILSSRIPYLQFDLLALHFQILHFLMFSDALHNRRQLCCRSC